MPTNNSAFLTQPTTNQFSIPIVLFGHQVPNILLEKNRNAPEGMKRLSQSINNAQLWMCLLVKVKYNVCKEQYCIGTWNVRSMIKVNWKWSNRRWQE